MEEAENEIDKKKKGSSERGRRITEEGEREEIEKRVMEEQSIYKREGGR